MEKDNYKSSLHCLALQPGHSGLSFEEFLLYFSNKDIGKLELAISEKSLRDTFHQRLDSFYNKNIISCFGEFRMIAKGSIPLEKCEAANVSIGKNNLMLLLLDAFVTRLFFILIIHYIGDEESEHLFSLILNKNPNLSEICFKYLSNEGLRLIATHCGQSLRRIEARVGDESADAIKALCQACPNLIVLILGNEDVSGDEIIPTIVQCCPMIEVVSADKWHLTDTAVSALAN